MEAADYKINNGPTMKAIDAIKAAVDWPDEKIRDEDPDFPPIGEEVIFTVPLDVAVPSVGIGLATGVDGLYWTPLMSAATWNTEPPPNS